MKQDLKLSTQQKSQLFAELRRQHTKVTWQKPLLIATALILIGLFLQIPPNETKPPKNEVQQITSLESLFDQSLKQSQSRQRTQLVKNFTQKNDSKRPLKLRIEQSRQKSKRLKLSITKNS